MIKIASSYIVCMFPCIHCLSTIIIACLFSLQLYCLLLAEELINMCRFQDSKSLRFIQHREPDSFAFSQLYESERYHDRFFSDPRCDNLAWTTPTSLKDPRMVPPSVRLFFSRHLWNVQNITNLLSRFPDKVDGYPQAC